MLGKITLLVLDNILYIYIQFKECYSRSLLIFNMFIYIYTYHNILYVYSRLYQYKIKYITIYKQIYCHIFVNICKATIPYLIYCMY